MRIIFQAAYFSSGLWVAEAYPSSSGCKVGPTLDRTPFCCRATHTHTHLLLY